MNHTFAICGYSDDIVSIEIDGKADDEMGQPKSFGFICGTKSLHVSMSFKGKKGTGWKLSVELQDDTEEGDLGFDVAIVQEKYSPKLVVKATTAPVSVVCGSKKLATLMPLVAVKEVAIPGSSVAAFSSASQDDCG